MKKDNDIRNFFKSSTDKTTALESKLKETVKVEKAIVVNKIIEEEKMLIEENVETKQKKGRKRKGAELDNEDGIESNEIKTKKKKINNIKDKESKRIVENPIPVINEELRIKIDSKGKKIIEDEDEEENEKYLNNFKNQEKEKEIELEMNKKEEVKNHTINQASNNLGERPSNISIIDNKVKNFKILMKPDEQKKSLTPIDPVSFFARGGAIPKVTNVMQDIKVSPKKLKEECKAVSIIQTNVELTSTPIEVDDNPVNNGFDDFDIDAMDLDLIANDMFKSEPEPIKQIKTINENLLSFRNKMEILEITEAKNETLKSNAIINHRNIKPFETNKIDNNKLNNDTKIVTQESLIAKRFVTNFNHTTAQNSSKSLDNLENKTSINNAINKNTATTQQNVQATQKPKISINNLLWTDIYHPKSVEDIIGNQAVVKKLIDWLNNWDDVVLNGNKREIDFAANNNYSTRGKNKIENINARACMISGPPGIGKTTTVRLVAKILNYKAFELNASDQRNKQIISSTVGYLMDNKTISNNSISNKNMIIMDEVDGMGGNEDKGGIKALIEIIKKTKLPIVCICNDIQNQKLRTFLNHCYELKFSKPDKRLVVKRLGDICRIEKFNISPESLEYLCESVGHDIRQCLNFLEMRSRSNKVLNHQDMKAKYDQLYSKDSDLMISVFDSCKKMLTKNEFRKLKFGEKMDLFFIDFELLPSLIFENYLSCHGSNRTPNDLRRIVESSEHISLGDVIEKKFKRTNEWTLLPNRGIHSSLAPAIYSGNFISYTKFPDLFGKFSKMRKIIRQLKELKQIFNFSFQAIKEEIVPLVFSKITNYLIDLGKEGVDKVLNILHTHKISLMLFKENLFDLQPNEIILKKFEKLNPGIKSLLTKKLNEEFKTSIVRKKKKADEGNNQKFDQDGNVLEEISADEEGAESEAEEDTKTAVVSKDTKKTKKTKK